MDISRFIIFVIYLLSLLSMSVLVLLLLTGARNTSKNFVIFILSLFIWQLPQFMAQFIFSHNLVVSQLLVRLSILFVGLVVPCLTLFIRSTLNNPSLRIMKYLSVFSLFLSVSVFMPITKLDILVSSSGIAVTSKQPLYNLYILNVFIGFIVAIFTIRKYEKHNAQPDIIKPLKTLRLALGFSVGLNIIGAVLFAKYQWSQVLTPVSMATMIGIMYVAIFKHRLYDVRRLVARSIAYVGTLAVLSVLYGWLAFGIIFKLVFKDNTITLFQEIVQVGILLGAAFTLQPLKKAFNKLSNKIFYRDAYDTSALLSEFNKLLVSTIDLRKLLVGAAEVIRTNVKTTYVTFLIKETEYSVKRIISDTDIEFNEQEVNAISDILIKDRKKVVVTESMSSVDPTKSLLIKNDIAVMIRLNLKSEKSSSTIGFLALGSKKSGNMYSTADISLLQILANELSIAIQNSLRFEEIQKFNETLQQKITDATREMRKSNEKLKALDEAKDEFISMASHQLRTPLTSVKGYVSMVLEGDAGKITGQQRQLLEQAFTSSQRMVYLIADLLNVSRLRTGKFVIEAVPTFLPDVVDGEVQQLKESVKAHSLDLTYQKPDNFPKLKLDETKIRQVIMNFLDNSIYYTPPGGHIRIELSATEKVVEYKVIDDGLGVPRSEQHHLFTKFFRAGNARKARPDGTGLGLYMAKKVIVAQGGSVIFESEEGKGSTFGFSFPRAALEVKE